MPGQNDVLEGTAAFRNALENIDAALPPGFEFSSIRQIGAEGDIVSVIDWKSDKAPDGSLLAVLFRLRDSNIYKERWFIDTEQWKAAF